MKRIEPVFARAWSVRLRLAVTLLMLAIAVGLPAAAGAGGRAVTGPELVVASPPGFVPAFLQNPAVGDGFPSLVGVGEMLLRPGPRGPQPWLASSVTLVNPLTWKVTLRAGLRFQNGKPLDARAVVRYLVYDLKVDRGLQQVLPSTATRLRMKVLDKRTIRVTSTVPIRLRTALAHRASTVFDVDVANAIAPNWNQLVGKGAYSGPFAMTHLEGGRTLTVTANPRYWGGRPFLQRIVFRQVNDPQAALNAVRAGEADIFPFAPGNLKRVVDSLSGVRFKLATGSTTMFAASLNHRKAPLDDVRVRRAVSLSIAFPAIVNGVFAGAHRPVRGLLTPDDPLAVSWQKFNTAEAARLLRAAGWSRAGDGIYTKAGQRLELTLITYNADQAALAVAAQAMLKTAGIASEVKATDYVTYLNTTKADTWHMAFYFFENYGINTDKASTWARHFRADESRVYGLANINDPELNEIFTRILSSNSEAVIDAGIKSIQEINAKKVYWLGVAQRLLGYIVNDKWKNYTSTGYFLDFNDHRLKP